MTFQFDTRPSTISKSHRDNTSKVFLRDVLDSGLKVYISKGDLVQQRVDAIVNPTNSSLIHDRGASKIIAKAAGKDLVEECDDFINRKEILPVTEVMHTTAGNLEPNIKYVIHAVGPNALTLTMEQKLENLRPMMVDTFLNCFKYANDHLKVSSIAVPAISAGRHCVPIEIVGSTMFKALEEFDKKQNVKTLKKIHFVNVDEPTVMGICKAFKEWKERNNNIKEDFGRSQSHSMNAKESSIDSSFKRKTAKGQLHPMMAKVNFAVTDEVGCKDIKNKKKRQLAKESLTSQRSEKDEAAKLRFNNEKPKDKTQKGFGHVPSTSFTMNTASQNDKDTPMEVDHDDDDDDDDFKPFYRNPENEDIRVFPSSLIMKYKDTEHATTSTSKPKNEEEEEDDDDEEEGEEKEEEDVCAICLDEITRPEKLKCGHVFCVDCFKEYTKRCNPKCPTCGRIYGEIVGNQPPGSKEVSTERQVRLPGYENCGTLKIRFDIPDGIQTEKHPKPGQPFIGAHRTAYLPNNKEGREVAKMLTKAFDKKLLFTIGRSHTTGVDDKVVWNDIHLKTSIHGTYGYPDPSYLERVKNELAAKGIHPPSESCP